MEHLCLQRRAKKKKRRELRKKNREQGHQFYSKGEHELAIDCFRKSVDVTPEMAHEFIKELRKKGIQYVVAPYEADAQLAYLNKNGYIDAVITEDSDMLAFGSLWVLFKLDKGGNVVEIKKENLSKSSKLNLQGWAEDEFRQMCILSGCDYLDSIPGIGLITANKHLRKYKSVEKVVYYLKQDGKKVPDDYLKKFRLAELTFKHQRVYDINLK